MLPSPLQSPTVRALALADSRAGGDRGEGGGCGEVRGGGELGGSGEMLVIAGGESDNCETATALTAGERL